MSTSTARFRHQANRRTRRGRRLTVRTVITGITLATALACAERPHAQGVPGFLGTITDSQAVFSVPALPRPAYLTPVTEPTFGTRITRITGDAGSIISPTLGMWGNDARQVYSKQQPWNSTGTLLSVENRAGDASASPLILDGETYQPKYTPCSAFDNYEYRWHPSPDYPNVQIAVSRAGTELMWFDVANCRKLRTWTLPFPANYGIGSGEGNVSDDGRYAVISDGTRMVVVDMDPRGSAPAYPFKRIGPVYTFAPCSLQTGDAMFCPNGNISISPSGRYIDLKFGSGGVSCDTLCDMHRIFEVDSLLAIRPHRMADNSLRCGSFASRPDGWVFPLKHADMALDPFDNNEDVLLGGRACPGSSLGRVVKVRLRDGKVTALTDPSNEASYSHGSARNTQRPGWFYVTYAKASGSAGRRFSGEIVAVKLDGSGTVQRFGHYRSTAGSYRAQAHAVPSPDGRRVLFASDWAEGCGSDCGSPSVFSGYVIDARTGRDTIPPDTVQDLRKK